MAENSITSGKVMGRVLKAEGVEYMFGLQGGHIWSFLLGAGQSGIKMVHFRHEQAGAYAADAYARTTGKVGLCFGTAGPGMTNQISGIAQAKSAKSPVVAIYGQHGTAEDGRNALQEGYAEKALGQYTKWTARVVSTSMVAYTIKKAMRDAMIYPQGPVAIEMPNDLMNSRTSLAKQQGYIPNAYPEPDPPCPSEASVAKAVKTILAAERPAIAAGEAISYSHAEEELREFVELTNVPVITRRNSRGAVPEDHPLAFSARARGAVLRAADVAVTIGLNLGFLEGFGAWAAKAKLIQITEARTDIEFTAKSEQIIIADPKMALKMMIEYVKKNYKTGVPKKEAWLKQVNEIKAKERARLDEEAEKTKNEKPMNPNWVAKATLAALDKNATIILDAYTASHYFTERFLGQHSGSVLDGAATAGIGHGVAMAVGAYFGNPKRQVLSVMGDGGMGLGGMDVESAVRTGANVVYLVNNNSDYIAGMGPLFKAIQVPGRQDLVAPWGIVPTNYAKMFENVGAFGIRVEDPAKMTDGVRAALNAGKAAVVDAVVAPIGSASGLVKAGPKLPEFMPFFDAEDFNEPERSYYFPPKK